MDWFSWLSRTNLDPSLTYEYALAFAHNELEHDDIKYFNHEFLQSMGISVAKHRLEILKLAMPEKKKIKNRRAIIRPVSWFTFVIKQTKTYLTKQIDTFVHRHHHESSIISFVPAHKRNHSLRWKVAMLQRNNRLKTSLAKPYWSDSPELVSDNNEIMMLTNGTQRGDESPSSGSTWADSEANTEYANPRNSSFRGPQFDRATGKIGRVV